LAAAGGGMLRRRFGFGDPFGFGSATTLQKQA
jgi:hypothetical protein